HPTTRVRFARRGKSTAQNPHLHATRTLMPSSHLWPKCSIALAAVKDKPTGGASAPSLTAAARDGEWSTMAVRNRLCRDRLQHPLRHLEIPFRMTTDHPHYIQKRLNSSVPSRPPAAREHAQQDRGSRRLESAAAPFPLCVIFVVPSRLQVPTRQQIQPPLQFLR